MNLKRSNLIESTEDIIIGETFNITNLATSDERVIFEERKQPGEFVEIVTTNNGYQPKALITIDCEKEANHFEDKTITSFILLYEGYHIITINKTDICILKVLNINNDEMKITVKCIFKFDINHVPKNIKFEYAINYALNRMLSINSKKGDYFAINRNRHYELRVLCPDENGSYYGYSNDGTKLLLNKKSLIKNDGKAKLMKVFYNNKFSNENIIIVDGYELEPITEDYIQNNYAEFVSQFGSDSENLYKMQVGGLKLVTLVTKIKDDPNNFNIKIVYHSWKKLSVLLLNDFESKNFDFETEKI